MAIKVVAVHGVSVALACRTFQISETCYRYSPTLNDENEEIADWLERLTTSKRTWGFGLCFLYHYRKRRYLMAISWGLRIDFALLIPRKLAMRWPEWSRSSTG